MAEDRFSIVAATAVRLPVRRNSFFFTCFAALLAVCTVQVARAQEARGPEAAAQAPQTFALTDTGDLVVTGGKAEAVEYQGRKAVRLTTTSDESIVAQIKGTHMQDGTIEADLAMKATTPPGVRMPGFIGIAFRVRQDASHYELFYLRPGNSLSEDQAMRNHAAQYVSIPGFDWYKLRREWPWIYESYADLRPETWTKVKIEVHGRSARLYVNGSANPTLIVDGLKGEDLLGSIALWGDSGEESYFSNLKITPAQPQPVENGGEAAGAWDVRFTSDYGAYAGSMNLHREGGTVTGQWSGAFGQDQPVSGTWRNGYVELTFNGAWPNGKPDPNAKPEPIVAAMTGWIDGDSGRGRMKVEGRAFGQWVATRKK
jgi:hypothetical protein